MLGTMPGVAHLRRRPRPRLRPYPPPRRPDASMTSSGSASTLIVRLLDASALPAPVRRTSAVTVASPTRAGVHQEGQLPGRHARHRHLLRARAAVADPHADAVARHGDLVGLGRGEIGQRHDEAVDGQVRGIVAQVVEADASLRALRLLRLPNDDRHAQQVPAPPASPRSRAAPARAAGRGPSRGARAGPRAVPRIASALTD